MSEVRLGTSIVEKDSTPASARQELQAAPRLATHHHDRDAIRGHTPYDMDLHRESFTALHDRFVTCILSATQLQLTARALEQKCFC